MTTSSEDVLLQVGQVRYKKGDGTLYVMSERLAWMLDHRDTVSVSHRYTDIKLQKISPEGKAKIQLQVVLHDNTTSTFQFVNKQGPSVATRERDQVKDLLVQLLPKFKRKVNKELEEKNRLLSENPALLQLYRDLVITQVISPEEFWSQHASNYTQKQQNQKQDVGVSSAFLADIKPQTDGCNGLRYNLTADIIECIFKTYPAVRKKHMEYVPGKLSESEFWTKFFQSHYFHRDRIHSGTKDIFTECAKLDDLEMKKEMSSSFDDPLVNISYFEDKTLGEGYGTSSDKPTSSQNIVHQSMIKRFNQHSIMVMKASSSHNQTMDSNSSKITEVIANNNNISNKINANSDGGGNLNKSMMMVNGREMEPTSSSNSNGPVSDEQYCSVKKLKILEKISYDDLGNTVDDLNGKSASHTTAQLNLTNVERYLQGPVSSNATGEQIYSQEAIIKSCDRLKKLVSTWNSNSNQYNKNNVLVSPPAAVSALGELTPGGALMKGFHEESLAQLVPPAMEKDLRHLYTSGCELLRHFWACFPPTTIELQEKVCRMHDALHRFHSARLQPFEDRVLREYSPLSQQLSSHLNQLLTTAYAKFELWQSRRKPALR